MAHTNSTPNYNLPQFLGTDKPAWLTDVNNAMSDIDTAIAAAKTTADSADTAVSALAITVGNHTSQLSTLSGAVTSQGNTLNTVTALIGNGTPTTTDQTIIGAINELDAELTESAMDNIDGTNKVVGWKMGNLRDVYIYDWYYTIGQTYTFGSNYTPKSTTATIVESIGIGAVTMVLNTDGTVDLTGADGSVLTGTHRLVGHLFYLH